MKLDELMQVAGTLQRTKEDDDRFEVQRLAHEYWNFGIMPPAEYYFNVGEYIKCHPEEFKGAGPQ